MGLSASMTKYRASRTRSRRNIQLAAILTATLSGMLVAGCTKDPPQEGWPPRDAEVRDADGATQNAFRIRQVEPNHGGFAGGDMVTIRGRGLLENSQVFFGEVMADPSTMLFPDESRILCITPGGQVGPVDVRVVRPDGVESTLPAGYVYDQVSLDPNTGTTSGGTFVRVMGFDTNFGPDSTVTIAGRPLVDLRVVGPTVITGKTPPGTEGQAVVVVDSGDASTITVEDGFEYYSGVDPVNGGLGGGPIQGELTIHLLDSYSLDPIQGAYVMLGVDPETPYQGTTGADGSITFSDPYLTGPQMFTAVAPEYERVSFVAFDAREVTAFMTPYVPPKPGTFPGSSYSGAFGTIRFGGIEQGGDPCDWDRFMPPAPEGSIRMIKVYQSQGSYNYPPLEPGNDGTITEEESCDQGYSYFVYLRPGTAALYALAGFMDEETQKFTPLLAGVTRGVTVSPGDTVSADIWLDTPLDESMTVRLKDPPPLDPTSGPVLYRVATYMNLGGDGYIVRKDLVQETTDATSDISFEHLFPLSGALADGTYTLVVEAYNYGTYPYSRLRMTDLTPGGTVDASGFLGIPEAVDPAAGSVPSAGRLIWQESGRVPSIHLLLIRTYPEGDPFWRIYLPGTQTQLSLPDLTGADDPPGYPAGPMLWHIYSAIIPGLNFDEFSYRYMSQRYWRASAAAVSQFQFAP